MARGGGGGSRSGGSGGSRSSGGRSSSSSSRGGSYGGGSYRGSSYGGSYHRSSYGGGRPHGPRSYHYSRSGNGMGVMAFIILIIVIQVISAIFRVFISGSQITQSTIVREALSKSYVNETGYYTDTLDWIGNSSKLEAGMKSFYNQTGIQPHIYITDDDNLATFDKANELYDQLFTDEAHFLVVWSDHPTYYNNQVVGGMLTKEIMDTEAIDILLDYLDVNYYKDITNEEFISNSFASAADRIMGDTTNSKQAAFIWLIAIIVGGIFGIVVVRMVIKRKKEEAKETERLLNMDLETIGNPANDLADKYK